MRPGLLRTAMLAAALCVAPAVAQDAPPPALGTSTGYNLLPQALLLIEATRAGVAFEAVPDSRLRVVRHMATGFPCLFLPDSEALVTVVAAVEGATAGED